MLESVQIRIYIVKPCLDYRQCHRSFSFAPFKNGSMQPFNGAVYIKL